MRAQTTDKGLTIYLEGHVDSNNAGTFEEEIAALRAANPSGELTLDASDLEYISSAGLRVVMRLLRKEPGLCVVEASPEVYDVFDVTGFNQLLDVRKALRRISIDGCELIGRGGNGAVYRLDDETIVKVYDSSIHTIDTIQRARMVAQRLLALGIPCAIAFDVVHVGDGDDLGLVFELLDCKTVGAVIHEDPSKTHYWASKVADLLKLLHTTEVPDGMLPDTRDVCHGWVDDCAALLSQEEQDAMHKLYSALPARNTLVHGDYHTGNILVQGDELLLIDVDDTALGDPVIDYAGLFVTFENVSTDERSLQMLGMTLEEAHAFYNDLLACCYDTTDEQALQQLAFQRKLYGMPKLLWGIARTKSVPEEVKAQYVPRIKAGVMQLLAAAGIA